jgi:nicotinamidase/pyrazinamidase
MDIKPSDALIVVDVQNDFCAGGALAVPGADEIIAGINALVPGFASVVLTQDWHPAEHSSFAIGPHEGLAFTSVEMPYGPQTLWPPHCIAGEPGAAFRAGLAVDVAHLVIRKGYQAAIDSYSAFTENDRVTRTGLDGYLRARGVTRVVLVGLALDYCVGWSALDARAAGFDTIVLRDLCRGIAEATGADMVARLQAAGVEVRG